MKVEMAVSWDSWEKRATGTIATPHPLSTMQPPLAMWQPAWLRDRAFRGGWCLKLELTVDEGGWVNCSSAVSECHQATRWISWWRFVRAGWCGNIDVGLIQKTLALHNIQQSPSSFLSHGCLRTTSPTSAHSRNRNRCGRWPSIQSPYASLTISPLSKTLLPTLPVAPSSTRWCIHVRFSFSPWLTTTWSTSQAPSLLCNNNFSLLRIDTLRTREPAPRIDQGPCRVNEQ